jgi:hypothetical protein
MILYSKYICIVPPRRAGSESKELREIFHNKTRKQPTPTSEAPSPGLKIFITFLSQETNTIKFFLYRKAQVIIFNAISSSRMIFTVSCLSIKLLLATPFMYNLI